MPVNNISLHGGADEILDEVTSLFGRAVVARVADDVLLAELRHRMLEKGCSVSVDPIRATGGKDTSPDAEPSPVARTRKPRQATSATSPQLETPADVPSADEIEPPTPAEDTSEQNSTPPEEKSTEPEVAADEPAPEVTRDQVIAALNSYAASRGGQVAGREKMKEVCGVARLVDIKPEQYYVLMKALAA